MKLGVHVSIAHSVSNAVDNATTLNCTAFQIFTRAPRQLEQMQLPDGEVEDFRRKLARSKIDRYSVSAHMPYFPNLSSPEKEIYKRSADTLRDELNRCKLLDIPYLIVHLGSHLGTGKDIGVRNFVNACNTASEDVKNDVIILLENNTGTRSILGSTFEEIRHILDQLEPRKRFGVCLDTCHAFASGYDLRTKKDVDRLVDEFDQVIGIKELKIVHLNDCMGALNSKMDAHEHIGMGQIGDEGFASILNHELFKSIPLIMETPIDSRRDDEGNLKKCFELAGLSYESKNSERS